MTVNYFVNAKKRNLAPIYVRFSAGRGTDLIVKSGLHVEPDRWSNTTQTIKQRIHTDDDDKLIKRLKELKDQVESEFKSYNGTFSKEWLIALIYRFHNKKDVEAKTLNEYIEKFIEDAKKGNRKGKSGLNIAPGTVRGWKCFKRIFSEYQGIYSDERLEELKKKKKTPRPLKIVDFEDVTIDFYNGFVAFLSNEGYGINTMNRFIKNLKYLMRKALNEKKHNNREFLENAFSGFEEEAFTVYLTEAEVEKIYKYDLSKFPRMELARDAFIVLCETALRISDYSKIDLSIRETNGKKLIYINQTKTGGLVVIPCTARMNSILNKYGGKLPSIPEQYVNKYIKAVCLLCEINEELRWEAQKFGKKYTKTAKKYELITCHSGRRTACTLMYLAKIPTLDIMKISGHKSEKSFLKYIRITPEETALRLADNPYFTGNTLRVAE